MNYSGLIDPWESGRLCLTLLHSLWQMALLAVIAWAISRVWRRKSVEWSYAAHVFALVLGLAAIPITYMSARVAEPVIAAADHRARVEPAGGLVQGVAASPKSNFSASKVRMEAGDVNRAPPVVSQTSGLTAEFWLQFTPWLAGLYLSGVVLMLIRLTASIIRSERLRSGAEFITAGPLFTLLCDLSHKWSLRAAPLLARSRNVVVPKLIGLVRPTILLPASAVTGFSMSDLKMILAHELAHVRRYDMWVNLLQRLAEVALFFNPALWYLSRRISSLREYCCDEMTCREVLATGDVLRVRYAEALLRVVELGNTGGARLDQLTAMAASGRSPSELRRRVARLFGEPLREPLPFSRSGVLFLAVSAIVLASGPMLWSSKAENTDTKTSKGAPANTAAAGDEKENTSAGKIEVLAIGTHFEQAQRWWDASGKKIEKVPFIWTDRMNVSANHQFWRRIVFRIEDLPKDAEVKWEIKGGGSSGDAQIAIEGNPKPRRYFGQYFGVDNRQTVDLRVGIATGAWNTVAVMDAGNPVATGLIGNKGIVSSGGFATRDGTVLVVSHNYFDQDHRAIAIDKKGKMHIPAARASAVSAYQINQMRPTFANVMPGDIDHFEFQIRDYAWTTIKDLPMEGGKPAKAKPQEKAKQGALKNSGPILRGRVSDEKGNPIPDVQVVLYGGIATRFRGQEAKTDARGEYRFEPLKTGALMRSDGGGGRYHTGIKYIHADYVPADGKWWHDVDVPTADDHVEAFDMMMTLGGKISGVVVDDKTSEPQRKLDLRIHNGSGITHDDGSFWAYATTDENGAFASGPLFPGKYVIEINDNNFEGQHSFPKIGHVVVAARETADIRLSTRERPELQDPFQISGTALGEDGKSMVYGGVGVRLTQSANRLRSMGGGIDGRNEFGLSFGPVERGKISNGTPYGVGTHDIELVGNNQRFGYKLVKRTPAEPLRITDDPRKPDVENGIRYIRPNQPVAFQLVFAKVKGTRAADEVLSAEK